MNKTKEEITTETSLSIDHLKSNELIEETLNDLEYASNCLDNLCIISQFCKISSLNEYIIFMEKHLN